jgi:hypothetical protein
MGLLQKLFGGKEAASSVPASSQFHESDATTEQQGSSNAPRRELVQVVLRDMIRKHGIPSDWMDCRILSAMTRRRVPGMHVQLIVRQGHDELLNYVYAFQESFLREIEKFEPRYQDWLLSLAWQFEGKGSLGSAMPDPAKWAEAQGARPPATTPDDDGVAEDLKALFAIRDAALKTAGDEPPDFQATRPGFEDSGTKR